MQGVVRQRPEKRIYPNMGICPIRSKATFREELAGRIFSDVAVLLNAIKLEWGTPSQGQALRAIGRGRGGPIKHNGWRKSASHYHRHDRRDCTGDNAVVLRKGFSECGLLQSWQPLAIMPSARGNLFRLHYP